MNRPIPKEYTENPLQKNWLSIADFRTEFHVSRATAYRMARHLPMIRIGSSMRISRQALMLYLKEHDGVIPTCPPGTSIEQ